MNDFKSINDIIPSINNIFFYWDGGISRTRLKILEDSVNSTAMFNPERNIFLVTNSDFLLKHSFKYNNITTVTWDNEIFSALAKPEWGIKIYSKISARDRSDLLRIMFLYKYGGSYVDTDDIALRAITSTENKNIICRSYDPHVCHYNKLSPADCLEGKYREVRGYDEIPLFPRNDCWLNFEPNSDILHQILNHSAFLNSDKPITICNLHSWQSITLDVVKQNKEKLGKEFNFFLTLLYVYESHVSVASIWDRGAHGGEIHDIWPGPQGATWGKYKTTKDEALTFLNKALDKLPYCSHFWLHDKDMEKEWLIEDLDQTEKYYISTWIYDSIKQKIK